MNRPARLLLPLLLLLAALSAPPPVQAQANASAPRGCGVVGPIVSPAPAPSGITPVLFVHGITSSAAMWRGRGNVVQGSNQTLLAMVAAIPGVATYTFDYGPDSLEWVDNQAIGPLLAKTIACLALKSGHKVVVVAHSMGGLATQWAAAQPDTPSGTYGDNYLARVITLGTPYEGSDLAKLVADLIAGASIASPLALVARALLAWCGLRAQVQPGEEGVCRDLRRLETPAGRALQAGSQELKALKKLRPWPDKLPVYAVAGDYHLFIPLLNAVQLVPSNVGDLIVLARSAGAGATVPPPIHQSCPDEVWSTKERSDCFHNNLARNPNIASTVVKLVGAAVPTPRAIPPTLASRPRVSTAPTPSPRPTPPQTTGPAARLTATVTVPATARWVDTGVRVRVGLPLKIEATGAWRPDSVTGPVGPDGAPQGWPDNFLNLDDLGACGTCATTLTRHWAALVGYIGDAPPAAGSYTATSVLPEAEKVFPVGSAYSNVAPRSGRLWLNFNDAAYSGNTADNSGQVTARIAVATQSAR
jgi:pimeloyl-ACP methyl ester carboxylesterase